MASGCCAPMAVSFPAQGHHGLIAGCSFAKDLLKAFLTPVRLLPIPGAFRDYVDGMTILVSAPSPQRAALDLHTSLTSAKAALRANNMLLNDSKEQVYGATVATRRAWQDLTGTPAVAVAKDLGVYHFAHGQSTPRSRPSLLDSAGLRSALGGAPYPASP